MGVLRPGSTLRLNWQWFWYKMSPKMGPQLRLIPDRLVEPGMELRDPWVQGEWLIHYTMMKLLFVAVFVGFNQYWPGGFMVLCPGAPDGWTGRGSDLKNLRRWGHSLKSHPTDWWSRGWNLRTPGTRLVTYPLHHDEITGSDLLY